eukprot:356118-Chlamydomonas_euryale.AAC.3
MQVGGETLRVLRKDTHTEVRTRQMPRVPRRSDSRRSSSSQPSSLRNDGNILSATIAPMYACQT